MWNCLHPQSSKKNKSTTKGLPNIKPIDRLPSRPARGARIPSETARKAKSNTEIIHQRLNPGELARNGIKVRDFSDEGLIMKKQGLGLSSHPGPANPSDLNTTPKSTPTRREGVSVVASSSGNSAASPTPSRTTSVGRYHPSSYSGDSSPQAPTIHADIPCWELDIPKTESFGSVPSTPKLGDTKDESISSLYLPAAALNGGTLRVLSKRQSKKKGKKPEFIVGSRTPSPDSPKDE